jgi:hypothetical protein
VGGPDVSSTPSCPPGIDGALHAVAIESSINYFCSASAGRPSSISRRSGRDGLDVPHIMEVAGPGAGIAYVSWLSNSSGGYAEYLRAFSVTRGWLSTPAQVSTEFGDSSVWPGDTTGISVLSPTQLVLSWGSATPTTGKKSEIFAADVGVQLP